MRQEKLNFGIILRIAISLIPILLGMPTVAMVWCAFNIAMSFVVFGPVTSALSSLSAIGISMVFYGLFGETASLEGLFLGLEAVLCAAGCILSIVTGGSYYTGVWLSSLGFLIPSVMSLGSAAKKSGLSIAEFLTNEPVSFLKAQLEMLLGNGQSGEVSVLENLIGQIQEILVSIVPSVIVVSAVVIGYIVMWCVCLQLRKITKGDSHSFAEIKIPKTMVIIMLVALGLYMLNPGSDVEYVSLNTVIVFASFCFFAGVSFIDFYLRRAIKSTAPRVIIHILLFMLSSVTASVSPFLNIMMIYVLIALIDSFVNFRKIQRKNLE